MKLLMFDDEMKLACLLFVIGLGENYVSVLILSKCWRGSVRLSIRL
jgi:hypothetical protein